MNFLIILWQVEGITQRVCVSARSAAACWSDREQHKGRHAWDTALFFLLASCPLCSLTSPDLRENGASQLFRGSARVWSQSKEKARAEPLWSEGKNQRCSRGAAIDTPPYGAGPAGGGGETLAE